jgi:hypothetical protein
MSEVQTVLLTHQEPESVDRMLRYWDRITPRSTVFLAFGGSKQHFAGLSHPHRALIDSPRLKTRDHQREKQSYAPVLMAAWEWLKTQKCSYVHFVEYDHVPLVEDFHRRMICFVEQEKCDVAGYHVARIDGSSNAHYLYHVSDPSFLQFWEKISVRSDKRVVLTMFGSGSFWRKEAFEAVTALPEEIQIYLELFQPTAAHHLGFRVRNFREQNRYVRNLGEYKDQLDSLKREGAWSVHPVKTLWNP